LNGAFFRLRHRSFRFGGLRPEKLNLFSKDRTVKFANDFADYFPYANPDRCTNSIVS